jgi:lactate permease
LAVLIISAIQGGGQLILTQINTTLAAFIPASICLFAIIFIGKMKTYRAPWLISDSRVIDRDVRVAETAAGEHEMSLNQAFMPYYCLVGVTLTVLLIGPIKAFLGSVELGFSFQETSTGYGVINKAVSPYSPFRIFVHAGTFLFVSALLGYLYFRWIDKISKGSVKQVIWRTVEKSLPATIGIIALVVMSKIMGGTGQIMVLAKGTAQVADTFYALLSPTIGILGSFITSSNLASNILFGEFQQATSAILGFNQASILGAQTAGGAMGNTISPGNVLLGTTTAGILGREGLILKMILPITLCVALFTGIILFLANMM